MTLPFWAAGEAFFVTLPSLQWAFLSFAFALASDRPRSFGTLQAGGLSGGAAGPLKFALTA